MIDFSSWSGLTPAATSFRNRRAETLFYPANGKSGAGPPQSKTLRAYRFTADSAKRL
jgi:hypothetical protein